jgi:hypothetical protein
MTDTTVTSTVLGANNPLTQYGQKFKNLGNSISGIGCGIVFLIAGIILIYMSIYGVKEYSKIVAALDLKTPDQVSSDEGLVKISGTTDNVQATQFTYTKCSTKACDNATNTAQTMSNVLHYSVEIERFEVVKTETTETTGRVENGQQIEDKITKTSYSEEWVNKGNKEGWGEFNVGSIRVKPNKNTRLMAATSESTINMVQTDNYGPIETYGKTVSDQVGTVRMVVDSLPITKNNYIVVGNVSNGQITSGEPFIITDKSDAELIKDLETSENTQRIVMMIVSWIVTFLGLSMLISPIVMLADLIPFAGGVAKFISNVIAFILATAMVLGGWLLFKFWYIFIILAIVLVVLAVKLVMDKKKK